MPINIQQIRGTTDKKPTLLDGQIYVDKTKHTLTVGDTSTTDGEWDVATYEQYDEVTGNVNALDTSVSEMYQQVESLRQLAVLKPDENELTVNAVTMTNANSKLTTISGTANQILALDDSGVPTFIDMPDSGKAFEAVYNTTTYQEIFDAMSAGKFVYCIVPYDTGGTVRKRMFVLSRCYSGVAAFYFLEPANSLGTAKWSLWSVYVKGSSWGANIEECGMNWELSAAPTTSTKGNSGDIAFLDTPESNGVTPMYYCSGADSSGNYIWTRVNPQLYEYSTTDLTAGTSALATGHLYFVYE